MSDILIRSLVNRIKAGMMTIDQVPPVYREAVEAELAPEEDDED